jgi:uncharacterized protein
MGRVLILIVIGIALWWLFRGFFRAQVRDAEDKPRAQSIEGEDMVRCARCGVNLPRSEARDEAGKLVCANNPQCR